MEALGETQSFEWPEPFARSLNKTGPLDIGLSGRSSLLSIPTPPNSMPTAKTSDKWDLELHFTQQPAREDDADSCMDDASSVFDDILLDQQSARDAGTEILAPESDSEHESVAPTAVIPMTQSISQTTHVSCSLSTISSSPALSVQSASKAIQALARALFAKRALLAKRSQQIACSAQTTEPLEPSASLSPVVLSRLVAARTPHKRRQLRFQLRSGSSSDIAVSQDEAGAAVLAEPENQESADSVAVPWLGPGARVSVGQHVLLHSSGDKPPYIVKITGIIDKKSTTHVRLLWYYRLEEVSGELLARARSATLHNGHRNNTLPQFVNHEVFESDITSEDSVDTILGTCTVVSDPSLSGNFCCRFRLAQAGPNRLVLNRLNAPRRCPMAVDPRTVIRQPDLPRPRKTCLPSAPMPPPARRRALRQLTTARARRVNLLGKRARHMVSYSSNSRPQPRASGRRPRRKHTTKTPSPPDVTTVATVATVANVATVSTGSAKHRQSIESTQSLDDRAINPAGGVGAAFEPGAVVWAQQRGYPRWPAVVIALEPSRKSVLVRFLGATRPEAAQRCQGEVLLTRVQRYAAFVSRQKTSKKRAAALLEAGWDMDVACIEANRLHQAKRRHRQRKCAPAPAPAPSKRRRCNECDPLFARARFLLTGFNGHARELGRLKRLIRRNGGSIIDSVAMVRDDGEDAGSSHDVTHPNALSLANLQICIAHHACTTAKVVLSLARGLMPVKSDWVRECTTAGKLVPAHMHAIVLDGTRSALKRSLRYRSGLLPVPKAERLLAASCVRLAGDAQFIATWTVIMNEAGAKIARSVNKDCTHLLVAPGFRVPAATRRAARKHKVQCITPAWIRERLCRGA